MPVHISDQQEAEIFEAVEAGVRAMILAKPPEFQANFPDPSDNLFAYGFTSQDITPMMNMLDKFQMVKPIQPVQVLQNFSIKGLAQLVTDACTHYCIEPAVSSRGATLRIGDSLEEDHEQAPP